MKKRRLIIDGKDVYTIDEECEKEKLKKENSYQNKNKNKKNPVTKNTRWK
ncbi:MAG: hypothetical protein UH963_11445 [Agathobacter sp.]|nr:hypothetical protein [Agathobacter sp.]